MTIRSDFSAKLENSFTAGITPHLPLLRGTLHSRITFSLCACRKKNPVNKKQQRERERDRERERQTDRERETERDRETDRQTETETETERQRERQRETERESKITLTTSFSKSLLSSNKEFARQWSR